VQVEVAADVDNPLCGANGASAIFGPQKGASPEQVQALDQALGHFADHCAQLLGKDVRDQPGSGAAGGMGFAAKAFMGAQFRPGVEVVAELAQLDALVQGADLVITGRAFRCADPARQDPHGRGAGRQTPWRARCGAGWHLGRGL
jgi:glycerate kinase